MAHSPRGAGGEWRARWTDERRLHMFMAYELGLDLISELAGVPERIAKRDGDLARQVTRAASSVPLNISEGNRRTGKDRIHLFRIAARSCSEVRTALGGA